MVKYAKRVGNFEETAKAKGSNLRVSFKKTRETANALKGKSLARAIKYLENVMEKKEAVPFRHQNNGVGRKAMAKNHKLCTQVRFPQKSARFLLSLLHNLESNAEYKDLDSDRLKITHIAVQRAPKTRRRVYRAHGRINGHLRQPCHIEIVGQQMQRPVSAGKGKRAGNKIANGQRTN